MTSTTQRAISAQTKLNVAITLMYSKEVRECNGMWSEEEKKAINEKIIKKLKEARRAIDAAVIEVVKGETHG